LVLSGLHRLYHRSESAAQQMVLPAAASAAVSLKRGRDRIRDLAGRMSSGHWRQRRGRVTWRCIRGSVEEIAGLLLRNVRFMGC